MLSRGAEATQILEVPPRSTELGFHPSDASVRTRGVHGPVQTFADGDDLVVRADLHLDEVLVRVSAHRLREEHNDVLTRLHPEATSQRNVELHRKGNRLGHSKEKQVSNA